MKLKNINFCILIGLVICHCQLLTISFSLTSQVSNNRLNSNVDRNMYNKSCMQKCKSRKMDYGRQLTLVRAVSKSTSPEKDVVNLEEANTPNNEVFERNEKLLIDAIAFNSPESSAELLSNINSMRENGVSREDTENTLDTLLSSGPYSSSLPVWTKSKFMARYSRRARMASLRRTLDMMKPPEEKMDDSDPSLRNRRRRSLVSLLRSLSNDNELESVKSKVPAIIQLERKAKKATRADAQDLRSRLPEGLETPKFEILAKMNNGGRENVEIRRYEPYSVCAVSTTKPRPVSSNETDAKLGNPELSGASSFGALAGYLFGKNNEKVAMKMTTPVIMSKDDENTAEFMSFVLPSKYWVDPQVAPQPLPESGVTLQRRSSEDRAIIMFGGYASKNEVEKRKKELLSVVKKDENWTLLNENNASVDILQYNDPFTPPWRRLNEASVNVVLLNDTSGK